jgi:surfactin family lipopeptide synthetase A
MTVNGKIDRKALPKPDLSALASAYVAPRNDAEQLICKTFCEVLEISQVGINDDFFSLGGNSIKAIRTVALLQDNFKVNVADIFKFKTSAELAANIQFVADNLQKKLEQIKQGYLHPKHFAKARATAAPISYSFQVVSKNIRRVLLTGATGYLGCNILNELLHGTDYEIFVLARAPGDVEALDRVNAKFRFYFEKDLSLFAGRVHALASDLETPDLGLDNSTLKRLHQEIDCVVHTAALVKHYGNYEEFYSANVQATVHLLEFAKNTRSKDFHYISTESVLRDGYIPGHAAYTLTEDEDAGMIKGRTNVYVKTKFEGELKCLEYRRQGVAANIYRVGNLSMISTNHKNQENIEANGFFTRVGAMLNLGMTADEVATCEVSPVDYTARAIVKLMAQKQLVNHTFHVFNPHLCNLAELLGQDPDLSVRKVTIGEFIDEMLAKINLSTYRENIELFMLHNGWLQEHDGEETTRLGVDQEKTNRILKQLGFMWPKIDLAMLSDLVCQAYSLRFKLLGATKLVEGLQHPSLLRLVKSMSLCHYPVDSYVLQEAESDNRVKFILKGYIDSYVKSSGGWLSSIQILSVGDIMNLESISQQKAISTMRALFDSVSTLEIDSPILENLCMQDRQLFHNIVNQLVMDKTKLQQMFISLA